MGAYSSRLIEDAVNELSRLPGVGRKSALRFALHILRQDPAHAIRLGDAVKNLREKIQYCKSCFNISDSEICSVCSDQSRDQSLLCVVEDIRDVIAVENTNQFRGLFHVLGGIISPVDGIGPSQLNIAPLFDKAASGKVSEIIFALPATVEGDTTSFYIFKKIKDMNISVSTIARGIAVGDELEYTDEITLARSLVNRVPYAGVTI
jgi:recombination protein RecR